MSQRQVVAETGGAVSQAALSRIESGQTVPTISQKVALSWALGVDIDDFLDVEPLGERVHFAVRSREDGAPIGDVAHDLVFLLRVTNQLTAGGDR